MIQKAPTVVRSLLSLLNFARYVVMSAVDVMANEPADAGADQNVGREMFLAQDAGEAETGGCGVDTELSPGIVIFTCNDCG